MKIEGPTQAGIFAQPLVVPRLIIGGEPPPPIRISEDEGIVARNWGQALRRRPTVMLGSGVPRASGAEGQVESPGRGTMGLFDFFFGRRNLERIAPKEALVAEIEGPGRYELAIVGESHYQDALTALTGGKTPEGFDLVVEADLVMEDSNPHDPKAVRVEIQGRTVGHLDRETARAYRRRAREGGFHGIRGRCGAKIRGGWTRPGREGHFGVWLDLPVQEQ